MRPWWLRPPADDDAESAPEEEASSEEEVEAEKAEPEAQPEERAARDRSRKEEDEPKSKTDSADEERAADKASSDNGGARKRREPAKRQARRRSDPPKVEIMHHEEVVLSDAGGSSVNNQDESRIALFCDLENVALGVRDSDIKKFELSLVLERLLEKGKIIVKKAYADWERYSEFKRPFHEAAIELIDIPQKYYSGKNSADIKMVVDAMDLCYSKEHLDTFAVVSGDSDFSPLVSKLKENNKYVIGIGVRDSSSNLLIDNCDEFLFYEDVWRAAHRGPHLDHLTPQESEVFGLMSDAMLALMRENKEVLWGSMIKQTMKRKRPSFNESTYGYGSFSDLLTEAQRKGIIGLKRVERSGSYVVTGFAK